MRPPSRALAVAIPVLATLAIPALALAAAPPTRTAAIERAPIAQAKHEPEATGPTLIPGALVRSVGVPEVLAAADDASGIAIGLPPDGESTPLWAYNVHGKAVSVPIDVPGGSTLLQVDIYGYAETPAMQAWTIYGNNVAIGARLDYMPFSLTGQGLLHAAETINSGAGMVLTAGIDWEISLDPTSERSGFVGVTYQYRLPTLAYYPIAPIRAYDSRFTTRLTSGSTRTISVKDGIDRLTGQVAFPDAVPAGAKAISFTITVTGTAGSGWVAVLPGTATVTNVSNVNWWARGQTLASGGIVGVGADAADREVTLVVGGATSASTHVVVDVTGYYM
jgi:hypothetical protein